MYDKFKERSYSLKTSFVRSSSSDDSLYRLNPDKLDYESLGQKIRLSETNGDILGISIVPVYDDLDCEDIDVRTVSKLDAFDLYEMNGEDVQGSKSPITPSE